MRLLTSGIFCLMLATIIEVFIAPHVAIAFGAPLFYLFYIRRHMGNCYQLKDSIINIEATTDYLFIATTNSVYYNDALCSSESMFTRGTKVKISNNNGMISVNGKHRRVIIKDTEIKSTSESCFTPVCFGVPNETLAGLLNLLKQANWIEK